MILISTKDKPLPLTFSVISVSSSERSERVVKFIDFDPELFC